MYVRFLPKMFLICGELNMQKAWAWTHGWRTRGHGLMGTEDVDMNSWMQKMWTWTHGYRTCGCGLMGAEDVDVDSWVQNMWTWGHGCRTRGHAGMTAESRLTPLLKN